MEKATLAGGCFWCLEAVFKQLRGVVQTRPGYCGGMDPAPTYQTVCSGMTGHAEAVQIEFRPEHISFETLLDVFFTIHDPTTLNRQGADVGTQYRSAIFFHNAQQEAMACKYLKNLREAGAWLAPIVTELLPMENFFPAEPEHHDYFGQHPEAGYCIYVVAPKIGKVNQLFRTLLKT